MVKRPPIRMKGKVMNTIYERIESLKKERDKYSGVLIGKDILEIQRNDGTIKKEILKEEIDYSEFMSKFAKIKDTLVLDMVDLGDMKLIGIKETEVVIIRFKRNTKEVK